MSYKRLLKKKNIKLTLIIAQTEDGLIGIDNQLPWYIPEDLRFFKKKTKNSQVIMGSNTFRSIIDRIGKPLPNRRSIVFSNNIDLTNQYIDNTSVIFVKTIEDCIDVLKSNSNCFVIGGLQIFQIFEDIIDQAYITIVNRNVIQPIKGNKVYYNAMERLLHNGLSIQEESILE